MRVDVTVYKTVKMTQTLYVSDVSSVRSMLEDCEDNDFETQCVIDYEVQIDPVDG